MSCPRAPVGQNRLLRPVGFMSAGAQPPVVANGAARTSEPVGIAAASQWSWKREEICCCCCRQHDDKKAEASESIETRRGKEKEGRLVEGTGASNLALQPREASGKRMRL